MAVAQPVATVLFAQKNVLKITSGKKNTLKRGMKLQEGDAIETGSGGQISIKYTNGTIVNLGPDSSYKISSYAKKNTEIQLKAQLNKGKIYSKTTGKKKEILKTPAVALAILGTEYKCYVPDLKTTHCKVLEGRISAHGKIFGSGSSFMATPSGVESAPFPAEGSEGMILGNLSIEGSHIGLNDSGVSQVELLSTSVVTTVTNTSINEAIISATLIEIACMTL